ncbi:MAG: hypothetical protein ACYS19_11925, partial [Planctomycetota bacterium]
CHFERSAAKSRNLANDLNKPTHIHYPQYTIRHTTYDIRATNPSLLALRPCHAVAYDMQSEISVVCCLLSMNNEQ